MELEQLRQTAEALVAEGKGILAADESTPTIAGRFKGIGVESSEENRRAYRELLLTTPGLGAFISGMILFDETLRQKTTAGKAFVDVLAEQGILPGIKVDKAPNRSRIFPTKQSPRALMACASDWTTTPGWAHASRNGAR